MNYDTACGDGSRILMSRKIIAVSFLTRARARAEISLSDLDNTRLTKSCL